MTGKSSKRPGAALTMGAGEIADVSHDMNHIFDDTPSSHHRRNAAIAAVSTRAAVAAGSQAAEYGIEPLWKAIRGASPPQGAIYNTDRDIVASCPALPDLPLPASFSAPVELHTGRIKLSHKM